MGQNKMSVSINPSEQAAEQTSKSVMPVRRDLEFKLPEERIGDWHAAGRQVSHFFNVLSLFFPDGERFFIHSIRNYRDRIKDPTLDKAVTAFIGQEAMHSREHAECNMLLDKANLPGSRLQARVAWVVSLVKKLPMIIQLAVTIALEHLTATMANAVLEDPRNLRGSEPSYANMWHWHALEETEHKGVAYDVWNAVIKGNVLTYLLRVIVLSAATLVFAVLVYQFYRAVVKADPAAAAENGSETRRWLFKSPGFLARAGADWLDYFRPGFHPWMHDNRNYLPDVGPLVEEVKMHASA